MLLRRYATSHLSCHSADPILNRYLGRRAALCAVTAKRRQGRRTAAGRKSGLKSVRNRVLCNRKQGSEIRWSRQAEEQEIDRWHNCGGPHGRVAVGEYDGSGREVIGSQDHGQHCVIRQGIHEIAQMAPLPPVPDHSGFALPRRHIAACRFLPARNACRKTIASEMCARG
jgi:hypothetical protein